MAEITPQALIPAGIVVAWPGSAASVPGGWVRCTPLDGLFPKTVLTTTTNPGTTGGFATHTHTTSFHSHPIAHNHPTGSGTSGSASAGDAYTAGLDGTDLAVGDCPSGHTHTVSTGYGTDTSFATSFNWDPAGSQPLAYSVVWIQSDGTATGLPVGAVTYWNTQVPPAGWTQHTASNGQFLWGAAAGAGGGLASGGGHGHTATGTHSHAGSSGHTHPSSSSGPSTIQPRIAPGSWTTSTPGHTHSGSAGSSATIALAAASSPQTDPDRSSPPYTTLLHIVNSGTAASQPTGILALWLGTLASIPAGWSLVPGLVVDRFLRGATAVSDVGAVGGQLGHSHTGGAGHQHQAIAGHTHTQSLNGAGTPDNAVTVVAYTANWMARSGHTHGGTVTTGTDFGTQSNTAAPGAAAVADGRPPYLEVAIIQFGGPPTCAITSPTAGAVLATPSPPVTWTLTGSRTQQDYQLQVYAADGSTVVYDSGRVVSTVLSAQVAPGFLRTGQTYLFRVIVNTTLSENAISPTVQVTTSWTAVPPITPVTVTPVGGT